MSLLTKTAEMSLSGEEVVCRDWGIIAPHVSVLKLPDFKTNTGEPQHIAFDPDF